MEGKTLNTETFFNISAKYNKLLKWCFLINIRELMDIFILWCHIWLPSVPHCCKIKACIRPLCSVLRHNLKCALLLYFVVISAFIVAGTGREAAIWCDLVWNPGHRGHSLHFCGCKDLIYFMAWFALFWKCHIGHDFKHENCPSVYICCCVSF